MTCTRTPRRPSEHCQIESRLLHVLETAQLVGVEPKAYLTEATRRVITHPGTILLPHDLLT